MNTIYKYIASAAVAVMAGAFATSCDDNTVPEPLDIDYGTVDKDANYQAYLQNLRDYRATDHKKVYAWFDCPVTGPANQSHRLTALPDSVDVVVLMNPAQLHPTYVADMAKVRKEKGMEFIYCIDFDAIKSDYALLAEDLAAKRTALTSAYEARDDKDDEAVKAEYEAQLQALATPAFSSYLIDNVNPLLTYAQKQGLDGVIFAFNGKATNHLTAAEFQAYNNDAMLFLGIAADWHKRFPQFSFDFLGGPQYLAGNDIINEFRTLFIRDGLKATNANMYSYYLTMASVNGVPTDKLGMMTTYISADEADKNTGVYSNGSLAIDGCSQWAATAPVVAVGIQNVQNDYFSAAFIYPHIRTAISRINPAIK